MSAAAIAAPSASIVKLPTAARRQVAQRWNKHTRAAAMELREDHAGRFPYMRPDERKVAHLADFMEAHPLTADRRVLFALIKALNLDDDAKMKLALGAVGDPDAKCLVELAFADTKTTVSVQSLLRRRGLQ